MNLSERAITIHTHTHLAKVFLVHSVVEFTDKEQGKCDLGGGRRTYIDQVVAGFGVDLSDVALENEQQRSLLR